MDILAIDMRREVREAIELLLPHSPVVAVLPMRNQIRKESGGRAVGPSPARKILREARADQAFLQVVECILWNGHGERLDLNGAVGLHLVTFRLSLKEPVQPELHLHTMRSLGKIRS